MQEPSSFGALNYSICLIYIAVMFGIGLSFARKQKTTEEYFLAGRRMPWFIVAISMYASLASASSYMALPGMAYMENISYIALGVMYVAATPFLVLLFYPFYRKLHVTTSYEYVGRRFGPPGRYIVSGLFIFVRLSWLGIVIYSPALALSVVSDINLYLAIILMGLLATTYTVMGGLSAVLWTDALQFVILTVGAIWIGVSLLINVPDGWSGIIEVAQSSGKLDVFSWKLNFFEMSLLALAISSFINAMQEFGTDQVTVQRLLSTKTFSGMVKATWINSIITLIMVSLLTFLGLGMLAYFQHFPDKLSADIAGDKLLPFYIISQLPNGVSGLLITAILAAAMSSMDSGINSVSTVIINDFVKPLRRRKAEESKDVKLARILTFGLGAFAVTIACFVTQIGHILKAGAVLTSIFAGPILALFLLGILMKRATLRGWLVGTIVNIPAMLWIILVKEVHFVYFFPFSFGISFIVGAFASLLLGGPQAPKNLTLWDRSSS